MKTTIAIALFAMLSICSLAQSFSINANIINLAGQGSTVPATDVGAKLQFTNNSVLRQDNIIATGVTGNFGGLDYNIPATWLKNTKLPAQQIQPYLTASMGVVRANNGSSIGALIGGGANYIPAGQTKFGLGLEVRWAKLPGYNNSTVIMAFGPLWHF